MRLPPEEGGLSWAQLAAYVEAAQEPPPFFQPVVLVEPD